MGVLLLLSWVKIKLCNHRVFKHRSGRRSGALSSNYSEANAGCSTEESKHQPDGASTQSAVRIIEGAPLQDIRLKLGVTAFNTSISAVCGVSASTSTELKYTFRCALVLFYRHVFLKRIYSGCNRSSISSNVRLIQQKPRPARSKGSLWRSLNQ